MDLQAYLQWSPCVCPLLKTRAYVWYYWAYERSKGLNSQNALLVVLSDPKLKLILYLSLVNYLVHYKHQT
jgi:hypothetical protein